MENIPGTSLERIEIFIAGRQVTIGTYHTGAGVIQKHQCETAEEIIDKIKKLFHLKEAL